MEFCSLSNLIYLPLFFITSVLRFLLYRKQSSFISSVSSKNTGVLENYSKAKAITKLVLFNLALVALCLALLNPCVEGKESFVEQQCREIFFVLDVSKSMLAQDLKPSRLDLSKEKIKKLLTMLSKDRVSLVLFSSEAFVQCPLTRDHSAFKMFLDQADVKTVSGGSTNLSAALKTCIKQYEKHSNQQTPIIVVFTDGEDFSSDLISIKKKAQDLNVKIFTLGIGTAEGAKIPDSDIYGNFTGYLKDKQGNEVVTKLNEGIIKNLATEFGGEYVSISQNEADIKLISKKIKEFEQQKVEDKKIKNIETQYQYFSLFALICALLEWLL